MKRKRRISEATTMFGFAENPVGAFALGGNGDQITAIAIGDDQYNPELDVYTCPAGEMLHLRTTYMRNDRRIFRYGSQEAICSQCTRKDACLPEKTPFRQISRWEHEHILEDHLERMTQKGREKSHIRAAITEHPFGTLKQQSGCTHLLLRGTQKVRAEMDLMMLSYNFRRVLNILGVDVFRSHCLQRVKNDVQNTKLHPQKHNFTPFFLRLSQSLAFITRFYLQAFFGDQVGFTYAFS